MRKYYPYPKRDAIMNYFPLPNEIFDLGLTAGEIALYAFLMRCEDRNTFQCYPSYRTIGSAINVSPNTVRKYVSGLCEKELIVTEPTKIITKAGIKRNGNLLYTIRPIEEAIRYNVEAQIRHNEKILQEQLMMEKVKKNLSNTG